MQDKADKYMLPDDDVSINQGDVLTYPFKRSSAKLIFCDPNQLAGINSSTDLQVSKTTNNFDLFTHQWCNRVVDFLRPAGIIVINALPQFTYLYQRTLENLGLTYLDQVIWHFEFGLYTKKRWVPAHMNLLVYSNRMNPTFNWRQVAIDSQRLLAGDPRAAPEGRTPGTVWSFSRIQGNNRWRMSKHIPQIPIEIVIRFILAYTNQGDLVIDPFCGSGTVPKACSWFDRKCQAIDINEFCVQLAQERLKPDYDLERILYNTQTKRKVKYGS